MPDEEKKPTEPPKAEPPKAEPPKAEPPKAEPKPTKEQPTEPRQPPQPTFKDEFKEIKETYERRLEEQKAMFEKAIAERDDVIKQFVSGKPIMQPENAPDTDTYIDKINKKRTYKKW